MAHELARTVNLPLVRQQRPRCPFYGFSGVGGAFMDTQGNQCGLVTNSHSPCYMEVEGQTPDWNQCTYKTPESQAELRKKADTMRVFPDSLRPKHSTSWSGVPLRSWYGAVMFEEI